MGWDWRMWRLWAKWEEGGAVPGPLAGAASGTQEGRGSSDVPQEVEGGEEVEEAAGVAMEDHRSVRSGTDVSPGLVLPFRQGNERGVRWLVRDQRSEGGRV